MKVSGVLILAWTLSASCEMRDGLNRAEQAEVEPVGTVQNPVRVSSGVMSGLVQHHTAPVFPPGVKGSGTTVLQVRIDPAGKVIEVKAISGPETLRERVMDTVRQWTYKPYLLNGKAVYVQTTVTLNICFGS